MKTVIFAIHLNYQNEFKASKRRE